MKWVTRKNADVDRIACTWLIRRFVGQDPTFVGTPMYDALYAWCRKQSAEHA